MYKISELIGKQAITLVDASRQGIVLGVCFDKAIKKLKGFFLLSEDDETIYFVEYRYFSSLFGDAVVVRSDLDLSPESKARGASSPINLPAYNQNGKFLGNIRDINLEENRVISFVTDNQEIPAGTILSYSDALIIFNDTKDVIKLRRPARKKEIIIETQGEPANQETLPPPAKAVAPQRVSANRQESSNIPSEMSRYSFLLGKRLKRSIYSNDGKLIARENELVTERTIKFAKEHGKLVAIALHSL